MNGLISSKPRRRFFFASLIVLLTSIAVSAHDESETVRNPLLMRLAEEPTIRIGLATNVSSVAISTGDSQLVAASVNEQNRFLAVSKITVTARAYRPPEIEVFALEIAGIGTRDEAEQIAKDVREVTSETALSIPDAATNTWRVRVGETRATPEEAAEFKELLSEKGFDAAKIVTEKRTQPSSDAIALSQRKTAAALGVLSQASNSNASRPRVLPTDIVRPVIDPNLREVIVSGASPNAKYASLKPVSFGSTNDRNVPVILNGKKYRGKIEVFVNNRGSLTVVNVVRLEDYLRGVVPNELSLPAIEAQKAQAVAARTYAVKNIGQFASQGFDMLPTTRSQVYQGFSSESSMGTRAVNETSGIVATYEGKPIIAYYTSTCGGRTENVENIFDTNEPYLRGVECSLEGRRQFEPFLIRSSREVPKIEREGNVELARRAAWLAVNGFSATPLRFSDDYFSDAPTENEMRNWMSVLSSRLGQTFPVQVNAESARPANFAQILATVLYGAEYSDTLMSAADVNYQLSFADADKVPAANRANVAVLLRDGWLSLYPDATLRPDKSLSRARILDVIFRLAERKKWLPAMQQAVTKSSVDGKLVLRSGKTERTLTVRPDVYLYRQFGDTMFQMKEVALMGGENVSFHTNATGEVDYLEIRPMTGTATAERTSQFTYWNENLSPSAVQSRLSRYVRGIGTLYDVRVSKKGFSRRAVELEIVGSNGVKILKGGKIRSALRLKEQLFIINKRYDTNGRVTGYSFSGRGWGHGVGMCQVGAYGLAKMGLSYDRIIKHYYSGVDLTKAY